MDSDKVLEKDGLLGLAGDPVKFIGFFWPHIRLYDKQVEVLEHLRTTSKVFVPAANAVGKDFIAGLAALWFFLSRDPCKVVTTGPSETQLESVLWGEIGQFIYTARYGFLQEILKVDHLRVIKKGDDLHDPRSYIKGITANKEETLKGHHLPTFDPRNYPLTLGIVDEASGVADCFFRAIDTWADRTLVISNCLPCMNEFYRGVKTGDVKDEEGNLVQKVIQIKAIDTPNVKLQKPILPGVVSYPLYLQRRALWNANDQTVGLDAEFYEGDEIKLFPPHWLYRANLYHRSQYETPSEELLAKGIQSLRARKSYLAQKNETARMMFALGRRKKLEIIELFHTLGVDTAEGGDKTVWTVIDRLGIKRQVAKLTKDTSVIGDITVELMEEFDVLDYDVLFDRGGGGKQHADYLRARGYNVRTIGFGEAAHNDLLIDLPLQEKIEDKEEATVYKRRNAEMYGLLSLLLDPNNLLGFSIPEGEDYEELLRQLPLFPRLYDEHGKLYLPPKHKPPGGNKSTTVTLVDLIGHSPDETDSLVLAVYGQFYRVPTRKIGVAF